MEAVLPVKELFPEQPQLAQAKEDDNDPPDTGKQGLVIMEEPACGSKAKTQQEKGKADAHHKEQGVFQDPGPLVGDIPFPVHRLCPAGEITNIKRDQRQHTGRKNAEQSLQKNGNGRNASFYGKIHG